MSPATRLPFVLFSALLISACSTITPYQPLKHGVGYSEQKLEANRYRISFDGNSFTERTTVQNYVLYRCAELTLAQGYDYFKVAAQSAEAEPQDRSGTFSFGFGLGGVSQSGFGLGVGTSTGVDRTDYQGSADITLHHGKKPAEDPTAYDAREVKANLEAGITRPKPNS